MSSPRSRMGSIHTSLCAALAALFVAVPAAAQRVSLVARSGGGGSTPGLISARACPSDRWTFRAASGDTARTEVPEVWLARAMTCAFNVGDVECVRAATVLPTRDATCDAGVCWTFTIPAALFVDPQTGSCATQGHGSTAVIVRFGATAVAFPDGRIGWDTAPPAAPTSVTVSAPGESTLLVRWTYPSAISTATDVDAASGVDADAEVDDVADVDASSALDGSAVPGPDGGDGAVAHAAPELLRGYWLLCEPADGTDASADTCPPGGFEGLDVEDDTALRRFAAQCGRGTDTIAPTVTSVTLTSLAEGRPYRFAVVAEDLAGNRSTATRATSCASAQRITDFWERYRADAGAANPGCAATPERSKRTWRGTVVLAVCAVLIARVSAKGGRGRRPS